MKDLLKYNNKELLETLWNSDLQAFMILRSCKSLHDARDKLMKHVNSIERHLYNIYSDRHFKDINLLEKNNAKECIRVFKNIMRSENEKITKFSALNLLYKTANNKISPSELTSGFIIEFIFLLRGINCNSGMYAKKDTPTFLKMTGRKAALERTKSLDQYAKTMQKSFRRYKTGFDNALVKERNENKTRILKFFNATEKDWQDYQWHLKNIIQDTGILKKLVKLSDSELKGLNSAKRFNIPFHITPHYLSLFDHKNTRKYDAAIRAQVLPSETYCKNFEKSKKQGTNMDFMGEKSSSPIAGITRRYPQIVILKPFDSCPQICVYCQRNWEITDIESGVFSKKTMNNAINWIDKNKNITEVLITGGDPLTLNDTILEWVISRVSAIRHIERIRIGTRIPVTMPQRITGKFVEIISKYHELGKKELSIVTHFEHSTEATPDSLNALKKIRNAGINIYNQQVFTYYNSKKYESCLLRKTLKKIGIEPYYTFNTKGKEETVDYRVPIPRIEQERKEEARFLPGLTRTDEPVFNVPRLGKTHLRAWQDHEVIMVLEDGRRVYRFYPWES
ncbi:MAG: KamA family radical SAM protein, partial [Candidatus Aenigmarchaeota archaeon]|nr:KamA family radical SAM protein [Candidatus Aenigmarchaeota archaeon]